MQKIYESLILFIACLAILAIFLIGIFMLFCGINSIIGFETMLIFVSFKMALYKSILMALFGGSLVCVAVYIGIKNLKS